MAGRFGRCDCKEGRSSESRMMDISKLSKHELGKPVSEVVQLTDRVIQ
jgi:hypothetical protein